MKSPQQDPKHPRKAPLRRTPIKRSTKPIKARKADPSKRRFAKLRDPAYQAWIRTLRCLISEAPVWMVGPDWSCVGRTECSHVKARSLGGADRQNCVPLCTRHHRRQHAYGMVSFLLTYDVDLADRAVALDAQYEASR